VEVVGERGRDLGRAVAEHAAAPGAEDEVAGALVGRHREDRARPAAEHGRDQRGVAGPVALDHPPVGRGRGQERHGDGRGQPGAVVGPEHRDLRGVDHVIAVEQVAVGPVVGVVVGAAHQRVPQGAGAGQALLLGAGAVGHTAAGVAGRREVERGHPAAAVGGAVPGQPDGGRERALAGDLEPGGGAARRGGRAGGVAGPVEPDPGAHGGQVRGEVDRPPARGVAPGLERLAGLAPPLPHPLRHASSPPPGRSRPLGRCGTLPPPPRRGPPVFPAAGRHPGRGARARRPAGPGDLRHAPPRRRSSERWTYRRGVHLPRRRLPIRGRRW
jgi:hypothetical protein